MKRSNYSISIITHDENFSGCTVTREKYITNVKNFLATVDTIRETIKTLFPTEEIDEKDKSIFEQIHDTFTLGFFKIKLKSSIEFSTKGIMFDEIPF